MSKTSRTALVSTSSGISLVLFAEMVARRLDIPLHVVDLSDAYRRRVVDYMFAEYERGRLVPEKVCKDCLALFLMCFRFFAQDGCE